MDQRFVDGLVGRPHLAGDAVDVQLEKPAATQLHDGSGVHARLRGRRNDVVASDGQLGVTESSGHGGRHRAHVAGFTLDDDRDVLLGAEPGDEPAYKT
jgi:hypothetical protein